MKEIQLPFHNIRVVLNETEKGGFIDSDLCDEVDGELAAAANALESVILAHAVAGLDIMSPMYLEGIETAIDAIFNNYT